jgi:hypothetical protein
MQTTPAPKAALDPIEPILDLFYDAEGDRVDERLHDDYFDLGRFDAAEEVSFQLPYGDWIRLLRANGFEVEDLIEIRPPEEASTTYDLVPLDWARRWPAENIWVARKRGAA